MRPQGAHGEEDELQTVVIQQEEPADGRTRRYGNLQDCTAQHPLKRGWAGRLPRGGNVEEIRQDAEEHTRQAKPGLGVGMEEGCASIDREASVVSGNCKSGF